MQMHEITSPNYQVQKKYGVNKHQFLEQPQGKMSIASNNIK